MAAPTQRAAPVAATSSGASGTVNATFNGCQVGDWLAICVIAFGATNTDTISSITVSGESNAVQRTSIAGATAGYMRAASGALTNASISFWMCKVTSAGNKLVTVTSSNAAAQIDLAVQALVGADATDPFDVGGGVYNSPFTITIAPGLNDYGIFLEVRSASPPLPTGWTQAPTLSGNYESDLAAYQLDSGAAGSRVISGIGDLCVAVFLKSGAVAPNGDINDDQLIASD